MQQQKINVFGDEVRVQTLEKNLWRKQLRDTKEPAQICESSEHPSFNNIEMRPPTGLLILPNRFKTDQFF